MIISYHHHYDSNNYLRHPYLYPNVTVIMEMGSCNM